MYFTILRAVLDKLHTYELNCDLIYNIYYHIFIPKLCKDKRCFFLFVGDDWKEQLGCKHLLCKKVKKSWVARLVTECNNFVSAQEMPCVLTCSKAKAADNVLL